MSNLIDHARLELEKIGEDKEVTDGYLKIIQAFADMGHSGGSASVAIQVITQLLRRKPLSPITDDPAEWEWRDETLWPPGGIWQGARDSEAFSEDGGKTYWLLSDKDKNPRPFYKSAKRIP